MKEVSDHFKETIKQYLDQRAESDAEFAERYAKDGKNINDCCTYILNWVQKSGCNGFTDDEIFGQAVHYYDEDNIDIGNPVTCKVVVNHTVELTEEETAKQRAHLTPEEVQEFEEYGVVFREATCVCLQYTPQGVPDGIVYNPCLYLRDMVREGTWNDPNHKILSAPNLQEVLEVLPNKIKAESFECWLNIAYTNKNEWWIGYEYMNHQNGTLYQIMGLKHEYNSNLLDAAVALLRWVCKNHPETLKRDE